ncbi:MAG TPA: V-type ATP synthase subunit I [Clostridiales bacterium]|nr:V-type ATP synthase subunit I [Clostridiales bacterium]
MSIVKMHKITLIGLEKEKSGIIESLMNIGVLDINDIGDTALTEEWTGLVDKDNNEDEALTLELDMEKVRSALEYLNQYDKQKKPLFAPKRSVDALRFSDILKNKDDMWVAVEKISKLDEELAQLRMEENRLENLIASLTPWKSMNTPVELISTKTTSVIMGVLPIAADVKEIFKELSVNIPESYLQLVNVDKDQSYIQAICHKSREEELTRVLKNKGFNRLSFTDMKGTINQNIENSLKSIEEVDRKRETLRGEIAALAGKREDLEVLYDYLAIQRDRNIALGRLLKTECTFILEGWVPEHNINSFRNYISKWEWDCFVSIEESNKDEDFPILLENNRFVQPFELVTELYSLPKPSEIDPNPFMAPFFFVFFGLMVGDAAYGLLMAIATGIVIYKFKPQGTVGKLLKLLFLGGISTFIWGALFGGWFGDIVTQVSSGKFTIPPLWFNPLDDPMRLLMWSFIFGGIQLYTAMGLKGYSLIREGKVLDAVFDIGLWYIFLTGLVLLLVGGNVGTIGKYMTIVGVILLILTQGRAEKNIFKKLTKGVLSLYNAVGFMSDVLSYSRLLALGLATGVIASVINTIGTLLGFNILGIIVLLIVFTGGHVFNILINALGAFVHSSRLQYVEFFGKFYEGGGKPYKPFKINTKYINITDGRKV